MNDLSCSYCLVEKAEVVRAVTITRGTAVCVACNFELHEVMNATMAQIEALNQEIHNRSR